MRPQCWLVYEGYQSKLALDGSLYCKVLYRVSVVNCVNLGVYRSTLAPGCGSVGKVSGGGVLFLCDECNGDEGEGGSWQACSSHTFFVLNKKQTK